MDQEEEQAKEPANQESPRRIRWGRIVLIVLGVIVLSIAGLITALFTMESATLKPIVERVVTVLIDRPLVLGENFKADLGIEVKVEADSVKMGNAVWSSEPYMLTVDKPRAILDLSALWRGQILIRDAQAEGARLLFEFGPDGRINWDLSKDSPKDPSKERPQSIPLLLQQADLQNVHITFDFPAFETPLEIQIDTAKQINGENDILDLDIAGSINEKPLTMTGRIGPFTTLIVGRETRFDIDVDLDSFELDGMAYVDDFAGPQKLEVDAELKGPEAAELTALLRLPEVTTGPIDINASMKPDGEVYRAAAKGQFGEFMLDLVATLKALNSIDGLNVDVDASGPDISVVAAIAGIQDFPEESFTLSGHVEENDGGLEFRDVLLEAGENRGSLDGAIPQFPKLMDADLKLSVKGSNYLQFRNVLRLANDTELPAAPFEINAALSPGTGENAKLDASARIGDIAARTDGFIAGPPSFNGTSVNFEVRGPDIKRVFDALGIDTPISAAFDARGNVAKTPNGIRFRQTTVTLQDNLLQVEGLLGYEALVSDTDLTVHYSGSDLHDFATLAGLPDTIPAVTYDIAFGLKAVDGGIELHDAEATVGPARIEASGIIKPTAGFVGTTMNLSVRTPEIEPLLPPRFSELLLPSGTTSLTGKITLAETGLQLKNVELSLTNATIYISGIVGFAESLAGTNLNLLASGPNFGALMPDEFLEMLDIPNAPFEISTEFSIDEENYYIRKLNASGARGTISGSITLAHQDILSMGSFALEARGEDLDALIPTTPDYEPAPVPFDIKAKGEWTPERILVEEAMADIDGAALSLDGEINLPPNLKATQMTLTGRGTSLASLGSFNGTRLPDKPFDIDVRLEGDETNMRVEQMIAHVGDNELTGSFHMDWSDKPDITLAFRSEKLDIAQFLPPLPEVSNDVELEPDLETLEQDFEAPADDGDRLIQNDPLPIETMNAYDLDLRIDVGELILRRTSMYNLDLDAILKNGVLEVKQIQVDTEQGDFQARLTLDARDDVAKLDIVAVGQDVALGLGEVDPEELSDYPVHNFALKMESSGKTTRDIATNLNGYADMITMPGRLPNSAVTLVFTDFLSQLFTVLNPFARREEYTELVCGTYFVDISDGVVKIDPGVVVQTDKLNMFATGTVDLNTERLNISFNTAARKGIGVSFGDLVNPFVKVGGTLSKPGLTIDPAGTVVEGGVAVATMGLSILAKSLYGRWLSDKDPCGTFIEEAKKAGRFINTVETPE